MDTATISSVEATCVNLHWDSLVSGSIPEGPIETLLLPDGLPSATSGETLGLLRDSMDMRGTLRVLLPPDLGIRRDVNSRLDLAGFDLIESRRGDATYSVRVGGREAQDVDLRTRVGDQKLVLVSDRELSSDELFRYQSACGVGVQLVTLSSLSESELSSASVLMVPSEVVPSAKWLRPMLAAHHESGRPTGCRLRGSSGALLHVGGDGLGSAWANGASTVNALLDIRREAELMPPLIAKALELESVKSLRGDLLADVEATAEIADHPSEAHQAIEHVFNRSLLVVLDDDDLLNLLERCSDLSFSPGDWIEQQQSKGYLVAISVTKHFDPWLATELARSGILLNDESDGLSAGDLARLLQPEKICVASNVRLDSDYMELSFAARGATFEWIGEEACARLERIDIGPAKTSQASEFVSDIPKIATVVRQPGLVSIVIPVYGMWGLTHACLESIALHTEVPYEVIVVDDCSPDSTLRNLSAFDVQVVSNEQNLGFPRSVNNGIAASRGEYVCVLNNDTEVTPGWLSQMLLALDRENVAMVGPRSNQITGRQSVPRAPALAESERARLWAKNWSKKRSNISWPSNTLIGFCLLSRRELYERLGGFEQGFGHGNFEDLELSLRVRDTGHKLHVADASVVLHHGSSTFDGAGIDLGALMNRTFRLFGDRDIYSGGLLTALVLSDSGGDAAQKAAGSVTPVADKSIILERGCLFEAEIGSAAGIILGVGCEFLDWSNADLLAKYISTIDSDWVLVIRAHEELIVNEWGRARAELAGREGDSVALKASKGIEKRIYRPTESSISELGKPGENPMSRLLVRQGSS